MLSARKITPEDYPLIKAALNDLTRKRKANRRKIAFQLLNVDAMMVSLYEFDHAYIVADTYLVVFEIGTPWYSRDALLQELLVLRLMGGASFGVVPEFLTASANEAGAKLALAGTALAPSDRALASLYSRHGFVEAARTLVKEI